jgi:hypothetical protein
LNVSVHFGNQSPYSVLFGSDPKVGFSSSAIPKEILDTLETEEDLKARTILSQITVLSVDSCTIFIFTSLTISGSVSEFVSMSK